MIRLGIVGTGAMAMERLRCFSQMDDVRVSAIYSRNIKRLRNFAESDDIQCFDHYADMLDSIDAVIICLPNNIHFQFGVKSLHAGKHVLAEYPLAIDRMQAEKLQKAASDNNHVLMVGNTIIHEALFRYIQQNKLRLGNIISAASRVAFYGSEIAGSWFVNPEQFGTVFAGLHYHHIEYYKHLLGVPAWVVAQNESRPDSVNNGFFSFAGGTLVMGHNEKSTSCIQWYLSDSGSGLPRGMWINGTEASLTLVSINDGSTEAVWNQGGQHRCEVIEDNWGIDGSCEDFIAAIKGKFDHRNRLNEDMQTLHIGFAASESAKKNEKVLLG